MVPIKILKEANIFKNLNDAQLEKLASIAESETHRAGTLLFKEGNVTNHFYIVEEGKVSLRIAIDMGPMQAPMQFPMATVTRGEAMAWSALVEPHKHSVSGLCMEDSKLVSVEAGKLRELVDQDPALGLAVMKGIAKLLASRLRDARILMFSERAAAQLQEMKTPGY